MEQKTANRTIDFIAQKYPINTVNYLFWWRTAFKKDLIKETIRYAKEKEKNGSCYFHYKTTTN
jgi:hypothetical protein